ncbi:MAG: hypothetical protein M3131_07550 [Actinomycetota bacterium]|nr:hypothetical protein [Actinomycetota bacterium]
MLQLTIRCHPFAPVSLDELERWLEALVDRLSAERPQQRVRLFRLTQGCPCADLDTGWLLELELAESEWRRGREHITGALADMRSLGLQTTVLAPRHLCDGAVSQPGRTA